MSTEQRTPVIAGNWKMFRTIAETEVFFERFLPLVEGVSHCEVVIAPPFPSLRRAVELCSGTGIEISAQNVFWEQEGAWTGEVSPAMLLDAGCKLTLIGHSERRRHFAETDETVNRRVRAALQAGLRPIVCVGESLEQREAGQTETVLRRQLTGGLAGLTERPFSPIMIAYEPVWAIGTGRTATPEIARQAHAFIRGAAGELISPRAAEALRILYGGSVKPDNIGPLMAERDIDGALVGGGSLDPDSFASIVRYR